MRYSVRLLLQEGSYEVDCPDVAGSKVFGKTMDEALTNVEDKLKDHFALLSEYGETIPQPSPIEQHIAINTFVNVIWAFIEIDITPYLGKSHKINVTLPELLIKRIDNAVGQRLEYKSRSGFIAQACLNELRKS